MSIWQKWLTFTAVGALLLAFLPAMTVSAQQDPPANSRTFPETGYTVSGRFLEYWEQNGGLPVFGYPLSEQLEEDGRQVQYFERQRFELHPENVPPYDVLLGRLGVELLQRQGIDWQTLTRSTGPVEGCLFFDATQQNVCNQQPGVGFLNYWSTHGLQLDGQPGFTFAESLALFGYPISTAFTQTTPEGVELQVQWFERARFEWHPDNPVEFRVLLGRSGAELLATTAPAPDPAPAPMTIEIPAANATATLPLHILARGGQPEREITPVLRWQDGTELVSVQSFTTLAGEDGQGLLITSLQWGEGVPPQPATQPATLELRDAQGTVLAQQPVTRLSIDDPNTQLVDLYWTFAANAEALESEQRRVPQTVAIGTAALEELLWGPVPGNLAGFTTALPTPAEVLAFPGRAADWGPRVTLRNLVIEDGVATADFSREMWAYGGGSARVQMIREQITRTLQQFPTVDEVRITIEGQTEGVLEP